jgi:hypothetical protein
VTDKRDKHTHKTPPAGIAAQIAGPVDSTFDDEYTDQHPTPVGSPVVGETVLQRIERRTGETKNSSIDTLSKINEVHRRIDTTNDRLDRVVEVVGELRETVGETKGQNVIIIDMLKEQRTAKAQSGEIRVVERTVTAEVHGARAKSEIELEKAEALAVIDDQKADRALRRKVLETVALKVIAGAGVIAGAIATGIGIGQCG